MSNFLEESFKAYSSGDYNKAISILKKYLHDNPNDLDALFNISSIYNQLGKYKESKQYIFQYLKNSSNSWEIWDMLSDIYFSEGNYEESLSTLNNLKKIVPINLIDELNEKIENVKEKLSFSKTLPKISFICLKGLDNFIDDIIRELSNYYWTRKFVVTNNSEIYDAVKWGDVIWLEWGNQSTVTATKLDLLRNKKVIVRIHRYEVFSDMPALINWKNVDYLIFVSPHIRETLFDRFPILRSLIKTKIIYNGVDLSKFEFSLHKKGFNIGWASYLHPRKNPLMMIEIISKLITVDKRYKLHIAGSFQDITYQYYFKYILEEMNLKDNVIFYGWIDDMPRWWSDKDYILSTSIHEGHPYNIIEGMARGIKPVIHNFEGSKKLFPEHLIFNTIDEAVSIIKNDQYNSKEYRKFIEDNYSLDNQIRNIKSLIDLLLSDNDFNNYKSSIPKNVVQSNPNRDIPVKESRISKYYDNFSSLMEKRYSTISKRHNHIFSILDSLKLDNKNVLEIGCGIGIITRYLSEKCKSVYAVDISKEMVRKAIEHVKSNNVTIEVRDVVNDNITGKYDLIVLADVLEHLGNENLPVVFDKIANLLNQDGFVYINIPYGRYNDFWKRYNPKVLQIIDEVIDLDFLFRLAKNKNLYPVYTNIYGIEFTYQYFETFLVSNYYIESTYKNIIDNYKKTK